MKINIVEAKLFLEPIPFLLIIIVVPAKHVVSLQDITKFLIQVYKCVIKEPLILYTLKFIVLWKTKPLMEAYVGGEGGLLSILLWRQKCYLRLS